MTTMDIFILVSVSSHVYFNKQEEKRDKVVIRRSNKVKSINYTNNVNKSDNETYHGIILWYLDDTIYSGTGDNNGSITMIKEIL